MVIVGIAGCFMLMVLSWIRLKDLVAPPFLLSVEWLLMYIIILLRRNTVDLSSIYYIAFFIGLCFFTCGFFIIVRNGNKMKRHIVGRKKSELKFNPFLIKILVIIVIALFSIFARQVIAFVSANYSYNFWQTLSIGKNRGVYSESFIISYARSAVSAFAVVASVVYFSNPNKKNKKYFLISILTASFFAVTAGNRGAMFNLVLAICFSYIIIKNPENKEVFYILQITAVVILTIFILFAFMKFVYEDQSNAFEFIMRHMRIYFSTPTLAFIKWAESPDNYLYGANTFRFFLALLNSVGYNVIVPNTVQSSIWVYGDMTNVYTVLHYYAKDFGLAYAFGIQLILGMIHGFFYKKSILSKEINPFYIGVQSFLYFPLINQFFDDKYFSIFSSWIQLMFWIWFFTRKGFLIREKKRKNINE